MLKLRKQELTYCSVNSDTHEKERRNTLLYLCSMEIRKLEKLLSESLQFTRFFVSQGAEALNYFEFISDESDNGSQEDFEWKTLEFCSLIVTPEWNNTRNYNN